jgi:formate-dependent nitrite reductase membrane component NrfD
VTSEARHALVPVYFHLGGIAGGSVALACLAVHVGGAALAPAGAGLVVAPLLLAACGAILTAHLTQPGRFWRVLTRFKWRSPISVGAWALAGLSLLSVPLAGWVLVGGGLSGAGESALFDLILAVAAGLAWFVAAYTGVLLHASSRPVWTRSAMPGAVFCVSGLAAGACWLRLLVLVTPGADASSAALYEGVALRLLVMAALLWIYLDRQLALVAPYPGRRRLLWVGLLLGYVVPVLLLDQGGFVAELGAVLALGAGMAPRTALYLAGEDRPSEA